MTALQLYNRVVLRLHVPGTDGAGGVATLIDFADHPSEACCDEPYRLPRRKNTLTAAQRLSRPWLSLDLSRTLGAYRRRRTGTPWRG